MVVYKRIKLKVMSRVLIAILLILGVNLLSAQSVKFSVEVSNDTVALGQTFSVTYKIENSTGVFQPPLYEDFYLAGGPNTQSSFQMINGEVEQSVSYNYIFIPKYEGKLKLGAAGLDVNGEMFNSPEVEILAIPNPDGDPGVPPLYDTNPYQKPAPKPNKTEPKKKRKTVDI
jgi:hypothetical protein